MQSAFSTASFCLLDSLYKLAHRANITENSHPRDNLQRSGTSHGLEDQPQRYVVRRRASLSLLYLVSILIAFGGVSDLFFSDLMPVQEAFLSGHGAYAISPSARTSFLEILHALGGGLAGIGFASVFLVHFGIRRGHRWAAVALAGMIVGAEGANTIGMFRLGSPFYMVTASYLALLFAGIGLAFLPTFAFAKIGSDND